METNKSPKNSYSVFGLRILTTSPSFFGTIRRLYLGITILFPKFLEENWLIKLLLLKA
jgi:hypothetical protein